MGITRNLLSKDSLILIVSTFFIESSNLTWRAHVKLITDISIILRKAFPSKCLIKNPFIYLDDESRNSIRLS